MRKIFLVLAFMLLVVITGCSKKEASTESTESTVPMESTEYVEYDENVQPVEVVSEEDFTSTEETLKYKGTDLAYDYEYNGYLFSRFDDFLSVSKIGNRHDSALISGYNFVLTEDKIWFVTSPERKIASVNFETLDLTKDFEVEKDAVIGNNYDLYGVKNVETYPYFKYNLNFDVEGKTLICGYEIPYTVLIDGQDILSFNNGIEEDHLEMTSSITQMAYTNSCLDSESDEVLKITYMTDDNTVGVLEFSESGIFNHIIDSSSSPKKLLSVTEDGFVHTQGDWAIYEKDGTTIASDGNFVYNLDELPYNLTYVGDSCGIAKGVADSAFVITYIDYDDQDKPVEELVEKYIK